MPPRALHSPVSLLRRSIAVLSVALLLLLSASAVSPALHERLHGHDVDHTSPSHACAVVLFGTGLVLATALVPLAPRLASLDGPPAHALTVLFSAPLHRLPPGRGPPAC